MGLGFSKGLSRGYEAEKTQRQRGANQRVQEIRSQHTRRNRKQAYSGSSRRAPLSKNFDKTHTQDGSGRPKARRRGATNEKWRRQTKSKHLTLHETSPRDDTQREPDNKSEHRRAAAEPRRGSEGWLEGLLCCWEALDFFFYVTSIYGLSVQEVHPAVLEKTTFGDCLVRLQLFAGKAKALVKVWDSFPVVELLRQLEDGRCGGW